jgi:hypothetical protein
MWEMMRRYLDPDAPALGAGGGTAAPAAPVPAPAPTATSPVEVPPDAVVDLGNGEYAPLSQLVERSRQALTPEQREQFELFQRVQRGDRDAIMAAIGVPAEPPATPADPATVIKTLEEQVTDLRQRLSRVEGTTTTIDQLRDQAEIKTLISTNAAKAPYLAHTIGADPNMLRELADSTRQLEDAARSSGVNLTPEARMRIRAHVFAAAENRLRTLATGLAGFKPAAPASPAAPTVVDDQPQNRTDGLTLDNRGRLVNTRGEPAAAGPDGQLRTVSSQIPGTGVTGGVVSPTGGVPTNGRMTLAELTAQMRAQREAQAAALQQ